MKLYFTPGTSSLAPHIALREAGLDFDLVRVDLRRHQLADGSDFTAINAKGYVPVLELDDGERLTETAAILQYIADRVPESGLAPRAHTLARYRLQEWLAFIGSELHRSFVPLFRPDTPEDYRRCLQEGIASRLGHVAARLEGRNYLLGEHFTVADAYLFAVLAWTSAVSIDIGRWPALAAFQQRVGRRPSVLEAIAAED
ncbi:glutathione transferase GstA [Accumulibacter sp.]|uniref:glutathione transferase GstA n=1 Tax=Accumulibacter sp. TaxID=2053492 RepID=UPI0025903BA0|nr:glutathione transferase GstA [Accumulibacter sp.]